MENMLECIRDMRVRVQNMINDENELERTMVLKEDCSVCELITRLDGRAND